MESLYRKYRPQTFADVVGQQHVVGTLQRAVVEGRTSHAYLFCGPRGTGKTTMARLLAKSLMCEQGPGSVPDGTCEQCRMIAEGEHPDVYELDAASRTGVDNVREEIINRVGYAPVRGRYKVYIIDEVHMLTTAAFNALLKTLEEPPDHVVFVLCTTDPQKIPSTILSRVQRFDFRPIGDDDIRGRLAYVCAAEGFAYDEAALDLVVRHARGGMRDALSTLEQLSVFGGGTISTEAAQDLLGAVPGDELTRVVEALAARDVPMLFLQVGELIESGRDPLQFARDLAAHVRDVYVAAIVGARPEVLGVGADADRLQAEARAFGSPDRLARMLTLLGDVVREMATAPNQRLALEIAFTRMARPEEDLTLESLAERLAEVERRLTAGHRLADAPATPASPRPESAQPAEATAAPASPRPESAQPAEATAAQSTAPCVSPATSMTPPSHQPSSQRSEPPFSSEPPAPQRPVATAAQPPAPQRPVVPATKPAVATTAQPPAPLQPVVPATKPAVATTAQQPAPNAATGATPVSDPGELQRRWRQVVGELVARLPSRGSLLSNATPVSDDGATLTVSLPKGSGFALKMLERPDVRAAVEGVVATQFGPRTMAYKEGFGNASQTYATQPSAQQSAPASQWQRQPNASGPYSGADQHSAMGVQPGATQPGATQQLGATRTGTVQPSTTQQPSWHQQRGADQQRNASSPYVSAQQYGGVPADSMPPAPPYPMPWDDPANVGNAQGYDEDRVPYEELGDSGSAEGFDYGYQGTSQPVSQPFQVGSQQSQPGPSSRAGNRSAQHGPASQSRAPQAQTGPASQFGTKQAQSTGMQSQTTGEATPASNGASRAATSSLPEAPNDLPADLAAVLANAFEVFGSDVRVSRG